MSEKITCQLCGAKTHAMQIHLRDDHPGVTIEDYMKQFPGAPLLSDAAKRKLAEKTPAPASPTMEMTAVAPAVAEAAEASSIVPSGSPVKKALHELFGLGKVKAALSPKGDPIPITFFPKVDHADMVPEVDEGYVYEIDTLKNVLLALELNIPIYAWGHAGTGKTTLLEQVCARTGRPMLRVQHTVNTEESHVVGQWTVRDGHTHFELGPLALAMKFGWVYCADEYDFALPSVLAVYQPVLEGKSLVIKEADSANRIIKPHPMFRFVATGNTNGCGDETGLYQGTNIQNAANYDRFGMVVQMHYMKKTMESQILQNQVGLVKEDADKMVDFASLVREAYDGSKISSTISPRTLINAGRIGIKRGSFRQGLTFSFVNKLSKIDREVVDGIAQRIFG